MTGKLIFLTSTVAPRTIKCSGSTDERRNEYLKAIEFYLNNTNSNVLIVDNSGYDFSRDIKNNRFESLSYIGEEKDEIFGKGYCETKILMYGFAHSEFIKTASQIVKVTGRHIIKNINYLMIQARTVDCVYANSDLKLKYPHSYVFIASKHFFGEYLFPNISLMNDYKKMHFEHILGISIIEYINQSGKFEEFIMPIYIIGHPGGNSKHYAPPSFKRYCMIFVKFIISKAFLSIKSIIKKQLFTIYL